MSDEDLMHSFTLAPLRAKFTLRFVSAYNKLLIADLCPFCEARDALEVQIHVGASDDGDAQGRFCQNEYRLGQRLRWWPADDPRWASWRDGGLANRDGTVDECAYGLCRVCASPVFVGVRFRDHTPIDVISASTEMPEWAWGPIQDAMVEDGPYGNWINKPDYNTLFVGDYCPCCRHATRFRCEIEVGYHISDAISVNFRGARYELGETLKWWPKDDPRYPEWAARGHANPDGSVDECSFAECLRCHSLLYAVIRYRDLVPLEMTAISRSAPEWAPNRTALINPDAAAAPINSLIEVLLCPACHQLASACVQSRVAASRMGDREGPFCGGRHQVGKEMRWWLFGHEQFETWKEAAKPNADGALEEWCAAECLRCHSNFYVGVRFEALVPITLFESRFSIPKSDRPEIHDSNAARIQLPPLRRVQLLKSRFKSIALKRRDPMGGVRKGIARLRSALRNARDDLRHMLFSRAQAPAALKAVLENQLGLGLNSFGLPLEQLRQIDNRDPAKALLWGNKHARRHPGAVRGVESRSALPRKDYYLLGFWGYGINSHAMYYFRMDEIHRTQFRIPYGGVYMDNEAQRRLIGPFINRYLEFERRVVNRGCVVEAEEWMGLGHYKILRGQTVAARCDRSLIEEVGSGRTSLDQIFPGFGA
jgi:hypothetical protein